jgi:tetrapyrrole methylase family protein/MazG family protein
VTVKGRITVVGLGPAGPELLTAETRTLLGSPEVTGFLRTRRHPAAAAFEDLASFDDIYEAEETIGGVYAAMVERLVAEAADSSQVVYAVPGSPIVAERAVELLLADPRVDVDVRPAMSFADLAWVRLGVDPVAAGVRIVDGQSFSVMAAGARGPLLVGQCDTKFVLSDIKLAVEDAPEEPVVVLQRLGLPDERILEVAWDELDRVVEPDHLTSLYIPVLAAPVLAELARFAELILTLRRECPWDREQTHESLRRYVIEEAYETVDAIDHLDEAAGEGFEHLEEELGDLLVQVFLHATIAAEAGHFTLADVARTVHDKLYARHPHVFGDVQADTPGEVAANWEQIKKAEKGRESVMDGIPAALPSLLLALKVQKKAANAGMDFPDAESALDKVGEELAEVRDDPSEHEVGDLLFAATGAAVQLGIEPEAALHHAARRFEARFRTVERLATERDIDLLAADSDDVDTLWQEAKSST